MLLFFSCISLAVPIENKTPASFSSPVPDRKTPAVEMIFSAELSALFVDVKKPTYTLPEIAPLMDSMRLGGDRYCQAIYDKGPRDRAKDSNFIESSFLTEYGKGCKGCSERMKTGCWNFFRMNDVSPNRDFEQIKKIYPASNFDCYAVGFLQPYIMHDVLNCSTLTMLDFDWRIHDAHQQMADALANARFTDEDGVMEAMADIDIGWVAYDKNMRKTHKGSYNAFCNRANKKLCMKSLLGVQKKWSSLQKVRLNIAGMHDISLVNTASNTDHIKVVFLSNAMEYIYTPKKEFDSMMESISSQLLEGQKLVAIHHAGGRAQFGLYEIQKKNGELVVHILCRDEYSTTSRGYSTPTYKIRLDRLKKNKKYPTCQSLR